MVLKLAAGSRRKPGGQTQSVRRSEPRLKVKPVGQDLQSPWPVSSWYMYSSHGTGLGTPAGQKLPMGQRGGHVLRSSSKLQLTPNSQMRPGALSLQKLAAPGESAGRGMTFGSTPQLEFSLISLELYCLTLQPWQLPSSTTPLPESMQRRPSQWQAMAMKVLRPHPVLLPQPKPTRSSLQSGLSVRGGSSAHTPPLLWPPSDLHFLLSPEYSR